MFRLFILLLFAALPVSVNYGQESHIIGSGKDFAGDSLQFFTFREPFFDIRYPVAGTRINDQGEFSLTFSPDHTECIYTEAGPYLGYVFTRPGHAYQVRMPLISNLSDEWKHNPYFHKAPLHLHTECQDCHADSIRELNHAIRAFDAQFNPFRNKQLLRYYSPGYSRSKLDSFRLANPVPAGIDDSLYFKKYYFYKMGILEFTVNSFNTDSLVADFFTGRPVDFNLPPYRELFRMVFENYYQHLSRKQDFQEIYKIFGNASLSELKKYLSRLPAMRNDTIFQSVLLDEIYKSYYSGDFPKDRMIAMVDSVKDQTDIGVIRDMANLLSEKFTSLQIGKPAPSFSLEDINGKLHTLKDFKGRYIYLGFCDTQSITCLREFEYLKAIYARHKDYLSVVTVIPSDDLSAVKKFANENHLDWTILVAKRSDPVFEEYNVRAFPQFYLIDKEGLLIRSPEMNPSAGFEQDLFRIMKKRGDI